MNAWAFMKKNSFIKINIYVLFLCVFTSAVSMQQKNSMKVLMVIPCFPQMSSVCVMNQITSLIDRGHDVDIFSFAKGDTVRVQEDVIAYDLINKIFYELPSSLDAYDIIMFSMGHKLLDIRTTHNYRGKIVVCLRGYDVTGYLKEKPHAYDEYFKTCDLFLPVCKAFKKTLEKAGCNPAKIIVHHSSIDCSKFKFSVKELPLQGPINIISAGRFVEKKGFIYSIHAIAQLIKKNPRIRYIIIGSGGLKIKYQKLIEELNICDKVQIQDWHTHEEYINILNKAHIFILPSVTARNNNKEGIANVLKEAMAIGLPVIATHHSGNSELIQNGISGLLVPERNSTALRQAIEYLLNNSNKWLSMQLAAAHTVHQKFEKEKENDKLEAILYALLEQK